MTMTKHDNLSYVVHLFFGNIVKLKAFIINVSKGYLVMLQN